MFEIFLIPFILILGFSIPIISLILAIWVAYDSITKQPKMETLEKIIWILLSFTIPIIVPILYYLLVVKEKKTIIKEKEPNESEVIETIEKLYKLKEEGAITEEEYIEKKKKLLKTIETKKEPNESNQ
ncbi:putative membrane protein containing PLD-nuclease N-terminal domain [Methanonatronarchaeum thermophilum]|uniref:Putative membrane protein containing PLD-nuclease N-terminal domain n=1 Tax=Methanonatronarchaeum thermophilum TaxID=1927129 RepID=A0A1Y3GIU0_9EURY|nr:SHOCT domain-containing protein [Methanonatronarchaeum thermophilum]OUJ19355.1 putative membrane protein containing PLD-nuclease N-terminal domain [Methanonatronarchaeum thermophilum]